MEEVPAIATMWKHKSHTCVLLKRGAHWVVTLEKPSGVVIESIEESPAAAIAQADEWFYEVMRSG
jgi:hypothetical protein